MAYIELIEKNLEKNKPEPLILPVISNSQYNYILRTQPIFKSINHECNNIQIITIGFFIPCTTILPLDPSYLYIKFCANNAYIY